MAVSTACRSGWQPMTVMTACAKSGYEPRTLVLTGHRPSRQLPASSCGHSSQPQKEHIKNHRETRRPRAPSLASVKAAITLGGPPHSIVGLKPESKVRLGSLNCRKTRPPIVQTFFSASCRLKIGPRYDKSCFSLCDLPLLSFGLRDRYVSELTCTRVPEFLRAENAECS